MEELGENHPHLQLDREIPTPRRRKRRGGTRFQAPDDTRKHGSRLRSSLRAARDAAAKELGGFDDRLLIKIDLNEKARPEDIESASSGIDFVSQENDKLVLAFASRQELTEFEAKLASLSTGRHVTYENILYAIEGFDRWSAHDRKGWALRRDGFPQGVRSFMIDAELWTLASGRELANLRRSFRMWIAEQGGKVVDSVQQPHLTIFRVRVSTRIAENLLNHRDVRRLDLLPRFGLELNLMRTSVDDLDHVPSPAQDAPKVAVLDSGIASTHPVLGAAVGDSQSFLTGMSPSDENGHGTLVSGIALYGDVAPCLERRRFVPELRLFSGRILDENNEGDETLIENQVERAVRYFVEEYDCRVFNLSYGDLNKPYENAHVAGLAVTLDALSRELGVLFVVPTGNFGGDEDGPQWMSDYPSYLTGRTSRLLDPAPALSALTVGSIARYEKGPQNVNYPRDPAYRAVARKDQPSPFTRHGPSVNGAIKPDLVDYGGNFLVDTRLSPTRLPTNLGLGELSTSRGFATGHPFAQDSGTSFAAPRVAHAAAKLMAAFPQPSVDLLRAVLLVHARTPKACADLFSADESGLRDVTGYGLVDRSALYRSADNCVTLWAKESIADQCHHFYEIAIPSEFWEGGMTQREITVALAYRPPVRTTRIEYKAVRISFKLVAANSLDSVVARFNAAVAAGSTMNIKERARGRRCTEQVRSKGAAQASTWEFPRPSAKVRDQRWFVVVTRNDTSWGRNLASEREDYAVAVNLTTRLTSLLQLQPSLYAQVRARLRQRVRVQRQG